MLLFELPDYLEKKTLHNMMFNQFSYHKSKLVLQGMFWYIHKFTNIASLATNDSELNWLESVESF